MVHDGDVHCFQKERTISLRMGGGGFDFELNDLLLLSLYRAASVETIKSTNITYLLDEKLRK